MKCYLSVLVWLVRIGDKQIDEREMCEIQSLMTRRRCSADVRKAVRQHLENPHSPDVRHQIDHMLEHGYSLWSWPWRVGIGSPAGCRRGMAARATVLTGAV